MAPKLYSLTASASGTPYESTWGLVRATATATLHYSDDDGDTYYAAVDGDGSAISFTAAGTKIFYCPSGCLLQAQTGNLVVYPGLAMLHQP